MIDRVLRASLLVALSGCASPADGPRGSQPSSDADGDRIVGADDRCPDEPEAYNGFEDDDGCRDRPPADREHCVWVDVSSIPDRIFFDAGSATVAEAQDELLDAIAAALAGSPSVERIAVVGGGVNDEPDTLAAERAVVVVEALVARGVSTDRLEPHGFTGTLDEPPGDTRSVWFVILAIDGESVVTADGEARYRPFQRDCEASRRAWRDEGAAINCECLPEP